ncbi:uncharacterized protein EHS24_006736 [Apiotrichum porosum]|uniref:DNA helicase rad5 n=1 Tax=Apiotrichum porosum TaxID=105984 RepID=A0A427XW28_9TREE|nr:uncharacterized protein EHS24_006736 [Apiotrichum porosum]RSH83079.1 hypothetical protein EHS24_006736 [Apiotrichum porosum]
MEGMNVHAGQSKTASRAAASRPSSQASSSHTPATTQGTPSKRARSESEAADEDSDDAPPQELEEHYVTMRTDVVGIQHYAGLVGAGEFVVLRRQPNNPYDANAVQVINAAGTQVGHIPRAVAGRLAPLMDANLLTVEGRMIGQNVDRKMRYKLPIDISIFARASYRPHLAPELAWAMPAAGFAQAVRQRDHQQQGGTGVQSGTSGRAPAPVVDERMQQILDGFKKVNEDEKAADGVMAALTSDLDVTKLPLHPSPPSIASGDLHTDLLPHQSQALQWMVSHENPKLPSKIGDDAVQFWTRQKGSRGQSDYWLNVATKTPQDDTPVLGRGGIMADGMGLGKTLTTLSLVLATQKEKVGQDVCGATLIVCPLSVISNWEKQIQDHIVPGKVSSYTYHGAGKGVTSTTLSQYDTLASDWAGSFGNSKGKKTKKTTGPLMEVKWKRVVADEGHVMKNPKAKTFVSLQAERRWVLTGTPIVNAPNDLGSLLTCIQVCAPLDQPELFRRLVIRGLKNGSAEAGRLLQAIVGQALLRRTKDTKDKDGNKLIGLPPIEYYQCPIKLDADTRVFYNEVMAESARRFQDSLRSGESSVNILSMLTRMRQLCLSADMVPASYLDEIRGNAVTTKGPAVPINSLSDEERDKLIEKLRQAMADQEECSVCYDILDDPRITDCGHPFCFACITEVIRRQAQCPMDRHPISPGSLLELPPDVAEDDADKYLAPPVRSAKISELVHYLQAFDKDDKTLVFSQFTTFLDRVAAVLQEEGIQFCRFDGSMSAKKRQAVIAQFQTPVTEANRAGNPVVMLISLKSGAVGLNLTAASNVFLSAIEAQAVDRVHRMGQRKKVRVFQLIAEDTIEAKVLEIQKRKDALVAKAFEHSGTRETKAAKKQARFEELKEIFGLE